MNSKLIDLLENINDLLFDETININKPEIRQEIKAIVAQLQNQNIKTIAQNVANEIIKNKLF